MMLSPRGQSGLETKILASVSASKLWPRSRPRGFGLVEHHCSYDTRPGNEVGLYYNAPKPAQGQINWNQFIKQIDSNHKLA